MPDLEAMTTTFLRTQLPSNVNVDIEYPLAYNGSQQAVMVQRIGGAMEHSARQTSLDKASLDLHCIGPNRASARDLADAVRGSMLIMWSFTHSLGEVVNVEELVGPLWVADPQYSPAGKYIIQLDVLVRN